MRAELEELVDPFPVSDTSLLRRRDLLRRVDTKFLVPQDALASILAGLVSSYAKVLAGEARWATYETLYFDTRDDRFFHDHRRGRLARYKVRIRHYVDRRLTFFEVKRKSNRRITTKVRHRKGIGCESLEPEDLALAASVPGLPSTDVVPRLQTTFSRLLLVGREHHERVTIDVGVGFRHGRIERAAALDDLAATRVGDIRLLRNPPAAPRALAIVEVKQPCFRSRTPIMLALRSAGARRRRSSKYCTGVVLTGPDVRAARFLPSFKQIARLQCSSC